MSFILIKFLSTLKSVSSYQNPGMKSELNAILGIPKVSNFSKVFSKSKIDFAPLDITNILFLLS